MGSRGGIRDIEEMISRGKCMPNARNRPPKDKYFMDIAEVVKSRSPDPKTQVGSVIVDSRYRIISTGFNGLPSGMSEDSVDWNNREEVYDNVLHAEVNAILYANSKFDGSILYVTMSPCRNCIKEVAASGIKTVIFKHKYKDFEEMKLLADKFGITLTQFEDK